MAPTEKAFVAGSAFPALEKDTLRLYSMRFCPFAHRTRMVLAHKKIPYEVVNINLKSKPDWFLERNSLGLVPTIEYNDKIVYESSICDDILDELYPENKLNPTDPYERAANRMLMERFGKVLGAYAAFAYKKPDNLEDAVSQYHTQLQTFEEKLSGDFFGGVKLNMVDVHLWPFFEKMMAFEMAREDLPSLVPASRFPRLAAWVTKMQTTSAVQETLVDMAAQKQYMQMRDKGEPMDFDLGL